MTGYVAPARFILTTLHRQDPDAGPGTHPATGDPADGWTVCGIPMTRDELWRPVEARAGDRLCGACEAQAALGAAETAGIQEVLL